MSVAKIVGVLGLIVLVLSAIVHIPTLLGVNLAAEYPYVWLLFPAGLAIFIFTVILLKFRIGHERDSQAFFREMHRMPLAARLAIVIFAVLLVADCASLGVSIQVPTEVDGQYLINNHGQVTYYSYEETQELRLARFRGWSAFWIWLTVCSTVYLLTAKEPASES